MKTINTLLVVVIMAMVIACENKIIPQPTPAPSEQDKPEADTMFYSHYGFVNYSSHPITFRLSNVRNISPRKYSDTFTVHIYDKYEIMFAEMCFRPSPLFRCTEVTVSNGEKQFTQKYDNRFSYLYNIDFYALVYEDKKNNNCRYYEYVITD